MLFRSFYYPEHKVTQNTDRSAYFRSWLVVGEVLSMSLIHILIADARTRAGQLLAADPELAGEVQLAGAVLDFTRGNETFLTSS